MSKSPMEIGNDAKRNSQIIPHLTSIICKNVHPDINKKAVLHNHFSKFGPIMKITCSKKNCQAVIRFENHAVAERAKKRGAKISPSHEAVSIFWFQGSDPKKEKEKFQQAFFQNPDIDDELHAMLEGAEDHMILPRPDEKPVEVLSHKRSVKPKSKTSKKNVPKHESPADLNENNLEKLLYQEAHTAEERFRILDARDKLLRLSIKKQSDLATAKNLFGTCTDMCPEKERYGRFAKKCLSVFEQKSLNSKLTGLETGPDHQLIVKEYSRSSADQEEPLPHELRPTKALQLTMDYLLCNVINRINDEDTSVGEWYDFIWNRTRAIRKDITQQHLCDTLCVSIVEKCVRFHIHCAAALCEEDVSAFDPKINDENLTKCLQTLKHLYQDLGEKGFECSNEAEFRAYDILLSLKEGDTLRHVQKLRVDIRNTPEVQFAVSAALAFNSNNYVRFFNLVEKATYLNACILHRYFSRLRLQAVQVLVKAFCSPNRTEQYPVENLCHILKFDNLIDASEFCKILGFKVENNYVLLDRVNLLIPVSNFSSNKSAVVENKCLVSLAEVINKGCLPPNPLNSYVPHNSFNGTGYLKFESLKALDQNQKNDNQVTEIITESSREEPHFSSIPVVEPPQVCVTVFPEPQNSKLPDPIVEQPADIYIDSNVDVHLNEAITVKEELKLQCVSELCEHILNEELYTLLGAISCDTMRAEQQLEKRRRHDIKQKEQTALNNVANAVLFDVVRNEITSFIVEERERIKQENLHNFCALLSKDILEKYVGKYLLSIAVEVYEAERKSCLDNLKSVQRKVKLLYAKKVLLLWRKRCITRRRLEACRNLFPSHPPMYSTAKSSNLNNPASSLSCRRDASHLLGAGVLYQTIKEEIAWQAFDLVPMFENCIKEGLYFPRLSSKVHYWKLLLLHEENEKHAAYSLLTKWLCSKFTKGYAKQSNLEFTRICSLYWLTNTVGDRIAVCVRSIAIGKQFERTLSVIKKDSLLHGTCAIFLCVQKSSLEQDQSISNLHSSIVQLLKSRSPVLQIPLYCLVIDSGSAPSSCAENYLRDLKKQQLLLDYQLSSADVSECLYSLSQRVMKATKWLMHQCPSFPELVTECLSDFIQKSIAAAFNVIYEDLTHRQHRNSLPQDPRCIVSFFNAVMKHRASLIESDEANSLFQPMPELAMASDRERSSFLLVSKENMSDAKNKINAMMLPTFDGDATHVDSVHNYISQVVSIFKEETHCLVPRIQQLMSKVQIWHTGEYNDDDDICIVFPWADIIYECVQYAVTCLGFSKEGSESEKHICYIEKDLLSFELSAEWQNIILSYSPALKRKCTWDQQVLCHSTQKRTKKDALEEEQMVTSDPPFQLQEHQKLFPPSKASLLSELLAAEKQESNDFLLRLQKNASLLSDVCPLSDEDHSFDILYAAECTGAEASTGLTSTLKDSGNFLEKFAILKEELESQNKAEMAFESKLKGLLL